MDVFLAQLARHGHTVHLRQHHIEDHGIVDAALGQIKALDAVVNHIHDVPFLNQTTAQRFRQRAVIFNNK
jgi:hypothetical protein